MPRKNGKKKKGRVIKPGMEMVVATKLTTAVNEKLKGMGLDTLGLKLDTPVTAGEAESTSALNESAYTYYSESVNQSQIIDEDNKNATMMQSPDVQNIRAELEAEEEETKGDKKQIFTQRTTDEKTRKQSLQIELVDANEKMAQTSRMNTATPKESKDLKKAKTTSTQVLHTEGDEKNVLSTADPASSQQTEKAQAQEKLPDVLPVDESTAAFVDDLTAAFEGDYGPELPRKEAKKTESKPKVQEPKVKAKAAAAKKSPPTQQAKQEKLPDVLPVDESTAAFVDDLTAAFEGDYGPELPRKEAKKTEPKVQAKVEAKEAPKKAEQAPVQSGKPKTISAAASKPTAAVSTEKACQSKQDQSLNQSSQMLGPRLTSEDLKSTATSSKPPMQQHQQESFSIKPIQTEARSTPAKAAAEPHTEDKKQVVFTAAPTDKGKQKSVQIVTTSPPVATPKEETKTEKPVEETNEDSDEEESAPGGGRKLLYLGMVFAAAAGAAFYIKKNNIPIEEKLDQLRRAIVSRMGK